MSVRLKITLLALVFLVASVNATTVSCLANVIPYINLKHGFSIHPPVGWTWDEKSELVATTRGAIVAFLSPETYGAGIANMIIGAEDPWPTIFLEDYFSKSKNEIRQGYPGFVVLSEARGKINGVEYCEFTGEHRYSGGKALNSLSITQRQVYLMGREEVYVIQLTTLSTQYYALLPVLEESLQTFTLGLPWRTFLIPALAVLCIMILPPLLWHRRRAKTRMRVDTRQSSGMTALPFCPYCGKEIGEDHSFCRSCGRRIDGTLGDKAEVVRLEGTAGRAGEMWRIFRRYDRKDPYGIRVLKGAVPWILIILGLWVATGLHPLYLILPYTRTLTRELVFIYTILVLFAISAINEYYVKND